MLRKCGVIILIQAQISTEAQVRIFSGLLVKTSANRNKDNQIFDRNVDKPKRRQTKMSTNQNVNKPKRRQTKTATNQIVAKPKRRQTEVSTNQNVDKLKRRQSKTLAWFLKYTIYIVNTHAITIEFKAWVSNYILKSDPNLKR